MYATKQGATILRGNRNLTDGLWDIDLNQGDGNGGEFGMEEQDHRDQDHREDIPKKEEEFQDIEKQYRQFILTKAEDNKHIQLQNKEDRAHMMPCVEDIEVDARVLAGMAIALGKKDSVVWEAYLHDRQDGTEVRQILFDWIKKVETNLEMSKSTDKETANGAGYGSVSETEFKPVGFYNAEAVQKTATKFTTMGLVRSWTFSS